MKNITKSSTVGTSVSQSVKHSRAGHHHSRQSLQTDSFTSTDNCRYDSKGRVHTTTDANCHNHPPSIHDLPLPKSRMSPHNDNQVNSTLAEAVYRIIKSLAKFSIRLGMSAGAMCELVRRAYVDAAEELIREEGNKVLTTRVCAMTGLYRKEVTRLRDLKILTDNSRDAKYNRSARVITGWLRDTDYHTAKGKPAVLEIQGSNSFSELVKRYSGDMAPAAMQQELVRLGVIEVTGRNRVKLLTAGYIASTDLDGVQILGSDTADLIDTIQHNIICEEKSRRFQRKVKYVDIPAQHVAPFRTYAAKESQKLLERLDRWLAKRDDDVRNSEEPGSRIGLGVYHIEKTNTADDSTDEAKL